MTAQMLHDISQYTDNNSLDHAYCIGHSLGAHLCGYVGYTLQDVGLYQARKKFKLMF